MRADKKPVVVSMGSVAASGGYWIATSSDEVWASPSTITGSIGIFGMFPTFQKPLAKHLGMRVDGVGTTWLSGALRPDVEMKPELKEAFQTIIDRGYEDFLDRVARARKMDRDAVDRIARGRVWSGEDAKQIGLVDQLGGLDQAVAAAAKRAQLKDGYRVWYVEKEGDWTESLASSWLSAAADVGRAGAGDASRSGPRRVLGPRAPGAGGGARPVQRPAWRLRGVPVRGRVAARLRAQWQAVHGDAAFSFEPFVVLATAAVAADAARVPGHAGAGERRPRLAGARRRVGRRGGAASSCAAPGTSSRATRPGRSRAPSATCSFPLLVLRRLRPGEPLSSFGWIAAGPARPRAHLPAALPRRAAARGRPPRCVRTSCGPTRSTRSPGGAPSTSWPGRRSTRCSSCRSSSSSAGSCCTR